MELGFACVKFEMSGKESEKVTSVGGKTKRTWSHGNYEKRVFPEGGRRNAAEGC